MLMLAAANPSTANAPLNTAVLAPHAGSGRPCLQMSTRYSLGGPALGALLSVGVACHDGIAAAWAAWTVFGDLATYVPASYGDAPPVVVDAITGDPRDVIVADFSYPREKILRLHDEARSLLVLDHHASAEAALVGLVVFDDVRDNT